MQRLDVEYTPDDLNTIADEERLYVYATGSGSPIIMLSSANWLNGEVTAGSPISIGVTAATGGRTFTGGVMLGRDFAESAAASYFAFEDVCY